VTDADIDELPRVVQRYMRFMGVVGRPRDWSFQGRFTGKFWLRPGLGWMPAEAWQYNSGLEVARIFVMRIRLAHVVPMTGRDTYLRGHGHMTGKLLDQLTVVDGHGDEFDIGELTTYLDDAILVAPSMLLGLATTWTGIDDTTFDVTLNDAGRTVRGQVSLDERGAPLDFMSTDRFAALPSGPVRAEWRTPVQSWERIDGRPLPGPFSAEWHLPDGPLPYIEADSYPAPSPSTRCHRATRRRPPPANRPAQPAESHLVWVTTEKDADRIGTLASEALIRERADRRAGCRGRRAPCGQGARCCHRALTDC
jgi:hypothetical protein